MSTAASPSETTPDSKLRRTLANWTWESVLAPPLVYLNQPGNYILATFLAGTLAVGPAQYGALLSIPFWCNVLQLLLSPLLARRWSARQIVIASMWVTVGSWLIVILMLARPGPTGNTLKWFAVTFALASLLTSITGVAWTGLMQRLVPDRVRGVYFARRNRLYQAALLAFILTTMAVVEVFGSGIPVFCGLFFSPA